MIRSLICSGVGAAVFACVSFAAEVPKGVYDSAELDAARSEAVEKGKFIAVVFTDMGATCPNTPPNSEAAMRKLKSKFVTIHLDRKAQDEIPAEPRMPIIRKGTNLALEEHGQYSLPAVFIVNAAADKLVHYCALSWSDPSECMRDIRDALEGLSPVPEVKDEEISEPDLLSWENDEGRTIEAAAIRIEGKRVVFRLRDGKEIRYPVEGLSDRSQKVLKELFPDTAGDS